MVWSAPIFAALVPLALSFPTYPIPKTLNKAFLAEAGCSLPEGFTIANFKVWTPSQTNNASMTVQFAYLDKTTSIQTSCQRNASSENVGKPGLAARYACDNPLVQFIWQEETLTLVETVCPGSTGSIHYETTGSLTPQPQCSPTDCNFGSGDGTLCTSAGDLQGNFTSLQPSPP
ncbi:hypothetical protein VTK73DRAFT_8894 [Phialemonium thermophilum]|uniref:AA1-like domain-containing protein n=1 Tax=Phialemonium thermophilum TaxID=223376 RepID=A0ABR3XM69_9PEZI